MSDLRIGAHTSIAGGVSNAVEEQIEYGGNCGQIFSHSPQTWDEPNVEDDERAAFGELSNQHDCKPWVIHASYLVNLCTPKDGLREKSIRSMQAEVDVADALGIPYVNVHLGAHTGAGVQQGLANAGNALDELRIPDGVTVLIESDAGSGTKLGHSFEQLAQVGEETAHDVGFCLDTAHIWAAGYDISTQNGVQEMFETFDDVVGIERLKYVHLNDSKHDCGTNKDEHAHIGDGMIGDEGMKAFINQTAAHGVPMVLETPTEDGRSYSWNIQRVRDLHEEQ